MNGFDVTTIQPAPAQLDRTGRRQTPQWQI
jgi:hypothetical protein